jgi:hypothetical protein
MMVYFRLLAGFTSFKLNRWVSHFFSIGPGGIFDSSVMVIELPLVKLKSEAGDLQPVMI